MDLLEVLQGINQNSMDAYGLSDMVIGTVTSDAPLEVTIRESMAPLPQEVLHLTAAVIEKKIPVLAHAHTLSGLSHEHIVTINSTRYRTEASLSSGSYDTDEQLEAIVCYEDGKPLPVKDGYIILNRGLERGDKVLLLRVMRGQQFIILSRIFERRASNGNTAAV